jgi:DNA-binding NarL/FixJ family response regulator
MTHPSASPAEIDIRFKGATEDCRFIPQSPSVVDPSKYRDIENSAALKRSSCHGLAAPHQADCGSAPKCRQPDDSRNQLAKIALIVEDHAIMREALATLLTKRLGFARVITASSLPEAVAELTRTPEIAIVLFGQQMLSVESPAAIVALMMRLPRVKTAIVSGSTRRADLLLASDLGVNGYIPKNLNSDAIVDAIEAILRGASYAPAFLGDEAKYPFGKLASSRFCDGHAVSHLTTRQSDVLALLTRGLTNKAIARELHLGVGTVKVHVAALLKLLQVSKRSDAARLGVRLLQQGEPKPID